MNDQIYTNCGNVLLAFNPYKNIEGLYDDIANVKKVDGNEDFIINNDKAHVHSIAQKAIDDLVRGGGNQSILISGESGSGKTSSAKYIIDYIISKCSPGTKMGDMIIVANKILESFGNAKTPKNDNSSRFGKLIKLIFNDKNEIVASKIENFLLEKTRISHQEIGESNFHVMYTVSPGLSFRLLPERDGDRFKSSSVREELASFYNEDEIEMIFRSLRVILYFGEIEFTKDSQCELVSIKDDSGYLELLSKEIGCEPSKISNDFLISTLNINGETIVVKNDISKCCSIRDSFIRYIYNSLFENIINRINECLSSNLEGGEISILDIYGFENMDSNNFEQFCINFANEKLHSLFIQRVFDHQQRLYVDEEIDWSVIKYETDSSLIETIEGKLGIINILNDESKLSQGSDKRLLDRIRELQNEKKSLDSKFVLSHYSGSVSYSTTGFIERNIDLLLIDVEQYSTLFTWYSTSPNNVDHSLNGNNKKMTTITQFKHSLHSLLEMLSKTNSQYIRCIKSNQEKKERLFDECFVAKQLQSFGMMEVINISSLGFPNKMSKEEFTGRFNILSDDFSILLEEISPPNSYRIGKTIIFMKEGILGDLEKRRITLMNEKCTCIQGYLRFYLQRKNHSIITKISSTISCFNTKKIIRRRVNSKFIIYNHLLSWTKRKPCIAYVTTEHCSNVFLNVKIPSLSEEGERPLMDEILLPSFTFIRMIENPHLIGDPNAIIEGISITEPSNEVFAFWIKNIFTIASHLLFKVENDTFTNERLFFTLQGVTRVLHTLLEDWFLYVSQDIELIILSIFNNRELSDCLLPLSPIHKDNFSTVLFDWITNVLLVIEYYNLDFSVTNQFVDEIFSSISKKGVLMLKDRNNSLCRWKVGVHLQHNIVKLAELVKSFNISLSTDNSSLPKELMPLFECSKLLQIIKARDVEDLPNFLSKFEHVTKKDFYSISNNYIPDTYEDGQPLSVYMEESIDDASSIDANQNNEAVSFYIKVKSKSVD